jgi:hypothetical protein
MKLLKARVRTGQELIKESHKYVKFFSSLSDNLVTNWESSLENFITNQEVPTYEDLAKQLEKLAPLKEMVANRLE